MAGRQPDREHTARSRLKRRPGGGAGWFDTATLPASYLAQFREVHIPRLGVNSFAPATTPNYVPRKKSELAPQRRSTAFLPNRQH